VPAAAPVLDEPSFHVPNFAGELDPAPYLALVPDDERCKGVFFHGVIDATKKLAPTRVDALFSGMQERRFLPFREYRLREHMLMTMNAVHILHPRIPTREAMRRLGWLAFQSLSDSMVGRVVFGVLGRDPERVLSMGPRAVSVSLRKGRLTAHRLGRSHFRLVFEQIYGYLDTYYVGVVEGALRAHGVLPKLTIRLSSLVDGEMDVDWA
jgi:uncharacterized protein (TIGR02265 family)